MDIHLSIYCHDKKQLNDLEWFPCNRNNTLMKIYLVNVMDRVRGTETGGKFGNLTFVNAFERVALKGGGLGNQIVWKLF